MSDLISKEEVLEVLRQQKELGYFDIVQRNFDEVIKKVEAIEPQALNQNNAGSTVLVFDPKTTQYLGQKVLPEPSTLELALRMFENPMCPNIKRMDQAVDAAVEIKKRVREKEKAFGL